MINLLTYQSQKTKMIIKNFKNITNDLLKNLSFIMLSKFFILFIGFLTSITWANFSDPDTYGKYLLFISFFVFFNAFSLPGLPTSAQISAAKGYDGNLLIITKTKVFYSTIGSLGFIILGIYYYFEKNDYPLSLLCIISVVFYPFYNLDTIWDSWINSKKEFFKLSILQALISLIIFISIVLTLFFFNNLLVVVFCLLIFKTIINLLVLNYIKKSLSTNNRKDQNTIKYGFQLSYALIIPILLMSSERFIISEMLTYKDISIFAISSIFPGIITAFYGVINRIITPYITEATDIIEAYRYLKKFLNLIILFFLIVTIVGYFFIDLIITTFYPKVFQEAITYAQILWIFCGITAPATYLANILRAQKIIKFSIYFEQANSFLKIFLGILMIYFFGLIGLVYTYCIANLFGALLFILYFIYEYKKEYKKV
tara:strand:+ start:376 stop:1659 length:1284 start_codon:yes stop_codon:yes gene_type:complete